jgi:hypothetical protein
MSLKALVLGFAAGLGFMVAQEFWWLITGWLSICRG